MNFFVFDFSFLAAWAQNFFHCGTTELSTLIFLPQGFRNLQKHGTLQNVVSTNCLVNAGRGHFKMNTVRVF